MKIDVNKVLEQLATAFNTTVEQLYPILIKQAYVAGVQSILIFLLPVIILAITYKLALNAKKDHDNNKDEYGRWAWTHEGTPFLIVMAIVGFIGIFTTTEMLQVAPTAFLNPEYWAIQEVLDTITPD